ncbi:MAG: MMPL family transporter [Solirubrobacterales bacterium]
MTRALYALGRTCAKHGWIVLAIWIALFAALGIAAKTNGEKLNDNLTLPGTGSQQATNLLDDKFPSQANGSTPVVFVAPKGKTVTEAKYRDAITEVYNDYKKDKDVTNVISPFSSVGAEQLSEDKRTAYIGITPVTSPSDMTTDEAQAIIDVTDPAVKAGLSVSIGGFVGEKLSANTSESSEAIGLTAAVLILLLTFGTLVAMAMPILNAIFGLGVGLSLLAFSSAVIDVPTAAPALATMIGLGVGIDYGLFIVTQHRNQLAAGMEPRESVARATAIAGGAVVFAGSTVIIALISLFVAGIPIVSALGYTSALVVFVAVLSAITMLPAVLGLLGDRVNNGKVSFLSRGVPEKRTMWHRYAESVNRHPWRAIGVAVLILGVMAIPFFSMSLGQTDDGQETPGSQVRVSYDALAAGFGAGVNGPLLVAVELSKPADTDQNSLERLQALKEEIQKTADVDSVSEPAVNASGSAAVYSVIPKSSPSDEATTELVNELRNNVLPASTKGQGMTAFVGGSTAGYIDLANQISDRLPEVIALVLFLSFFLLMMAFRSVLVPLKAVVMNVFSIAAAFGVVSYVFSHDWTARLVGLEQAVPIVSFVPLMMFAILFGLSMDYEVFLMTHVREEYLVSGDARGAVVEGLAGTARVITSAALIMVSVFCAFILDGDPNIKQFGVGMAAAVLIDATVVRCALVPGIMRLMGDRAWWFPSWLDRVTPRLSIEGREWFARRDAESAASGERDTAS